MFMYSYFCQLSSTAKNCAELQQGGQTICGVFRIDTDGSGAFDVYLLVLTSEI